ncbi:MAG: CHAT domain-containing protein, partial [Novosphingobium sp.]
HFATHGLVTPPRPGCPVRPALLTSFGGAGSDGLLSFGEIFNLSLDADLVVLSGCDTAAGAGLGVTRETGLTTGGGEALDGLVRAFIAAGGRQVIASHWPAPDDFNATERLFAGFYRAKGAAIGEALRVSERKLMDDPETSHPYYWAGFAVIGDAARPVPAR